MMLIPIVAGIIVARLIFFDGGNKKKCAVKRKKVKEPAEKEPFSWVDL